MTKHLYSSDSKIIKRIYGKKRGWVFTPSHFLDLGSSDAIDLALRRYTKKGIIRRLARGLYDYPRKHPRLGILAPSIEAIAMSLKKKNSIRLQASGAYAANLLGLSDQVPMRIVFLTDGSSKKIKIGRQTIELKHTAPRHLAVADRTSGMVIQALRYLGQRNIRSSTIFQLCSVLSLSEKRQLLKDVIYAPAWMGEIIRKIAQHTED